MIVYKKEINPNGWHLGIKPKYYIKDNIQNIEYEISETNYKELLKLYEDNDEI